jgi:hypothetical protein
MEEKEKTKVLEVEDRQHELILCFDFAIESVYDLEQLNDLAELVEVSSPKLINEELKLKLNALITQRIKKNALKHNYQA